MGREAHRRMSRPHAVAQGLGWFSIALGIAELAAPQAITRALGMRGYEPVVRMYGVREIMTGVGILTARDRAPWMQGRVAGDVLDMATLAAGLSGHRRGNVLGALAAVAGITALDAWCAGCLQRPRERPPQRLLARVFDYSDRRGMPLPAHAMRGAARDFDVPRDFRTPELLRPFTL